MFRNEKGNNIYCLGLMGTDAMLGGLRNGFQFWATCLLITSSREWTSLFFRDKSPCPWPASYWVFCKTVYNLFPIALLDYIKNPTFLCAVLKKQLWQVNESPSLCKISIASGQGAVSYCLYCTTTNAVL